MKTLKNTAISLFFAISVAGVSSVAFAYESVDSVLSKISEAKAAITAGKANTDVATAIAEAKSKSKQLGASDKMAGEVQRAAQHLSKAIGALKENDPKQASDHLDQGTKAFTELKAKL